MCSDAYGERRHRSRCLLYETNSAKQSGCRGLVGQSACLVNRRSWVQIPAVPSSSGCFCPIWKTQTILTTFAISAPVCQTQARMRLTTGSLFFKLSANRCQFTAQTSSRLLVLWFRWWLHLSSKHEILGSNPSSALTAICDSLSPEGSTFSLKTPNVHGAVIRKFTLPRKIL